ncbi:MAG: histidine--tRNA ligase, partial [Malacoplasma sp.]
MKYLKPRGTTDIYGEDIDYFNFVCETLKIIAQLYSFKEMQTPIFESKELFQKNIGTETDIVVKEFYDFKDKGNRDLVLRPEGTLSIARSVIENKLLHSNKLPLKYFYIGSMFRYERPQSGRQREFHQFGIEYISIKNVYQQIELIMMSINILNTFKLKKTVLKINYIGKLETREKWINSLKKYFSKYKKELTADSVDRINKNPLRILDDKVDSKKDCVINAPKIDSFLTPEEIVERDEILNILNKSKVEYTLDSNMVRGLDYYSGLVFEFISTLDVLNNQSTIIGGGKYENMFSDMGEDNHACIGFALGIERLIIALKDENPLPPRNNVDVYFANITNDNFVSLIIISMLRSSGISVDCDFSISKLDKHFKFAEKISPKIILIFGNKEKDDEKIIMKFQKTGKEKIVKLDNLAKEIQKFLKVKN